MSDDEQFSRRQMLRGGFLRGAADALAKALQAAAPASAPPPGNSPSVRGGLTGRRFALPIHRPPGAVDEAAFLAGCTRCNECLKVCPVSAIVHAPARFREAAGTPMIDASTTACIFCEDTPCITACEPGVLTRDQPLKMGLAWIQTMACLAYTGSFCTVCSERCPVPGAIEVRAGKPTIRPDVCTGCGVCAEVCPAPQNAVVIMPLADRPKRETPSADGPEGRAGIA